MQKPLLALVLVVLPVVACAAGRASSAPPVAPPQSVRGPKIVVVDMQRAVLATAEGMRAQATMTRMFEKRQADLDRRRADLVRERDEIEGLEGKLPKEELAARATVWAGKMAALQGDHAAYNSELQKKQGELTAPLMRRMSEVIRREAKREGATMVIDKQALAFVEPELDVTDRMVAAYDAQ